MEPRNLHQKVPVAGNSASWHINIPVLIYIVSLHLLSVLALWFYTKTSILLCISLYLITGFGVTVGYHRLLTHHSFHTSLWMKRVFAIAGALAGQGGPLFWVSTHRLHHLVSDQNGDPHDARRGFLWSHFAWTIFSDQPLKTDLEKVPDLSGDRLLCWLDRWDLLLQLFLAGLLFGLILLTSDFYNAVASLIWAFPLRILIVLHCTWLTNSAAHLWGSRRFGTPDHSRNNLWVALLTLGEGWHNNHHAFPGSARHGLAWYEFDPSWLLIKSLKYLKLVSNVRAATPPSRFP